MVVGHIEVGTNLNNLANIHINLGDREEMSQAIDHLQSALIIYKQHFRNDHPKIANIYHNLGRAYFILEDINQSLDYFNKALDIRVSQLGKEHPQTQTTLLMIGICKNIQKNSSRNRPM